MTTNLKQKIMIMETEVDKIKYELVEGKRCLECQFKRKETGCYLMGMECAIQNKVWKIKSENRVET